MVARKRTSSVPPQALLDTIAGIGGVALEGLEMPPALAARIAAEKEAQQQIDRQIEVSQQYVAIVVTGTRTKLIPVHHG